MLLERPAIPIAQPIGFRPEATARADLPAEASQVVDRLCRLERLPGAGWFLLHFLAEPNRPAAPPRAVLPCRLLEAMEALAADRPGCTFRVTGETTVYHRRAFLLLRKATVVSDGPAGDSRGPASRPAEPDAPDPGGDLADDVAALLLAERPGRELVATRPAEVTTDPVPSVAPKAGQKQMTLGHRRLIVDRLVRVLPGAGEAAGWRVAAFEADNTLQEAPIRLLPCRLLEQAERQFGAPGGLGQRYRVSGEVTVYKGQRYLLLRKRLYEYAMDRL
jgi:hypothetical protein